MTLFTWSKYSYLLHNFIYKHPNYIEILIYTLKLYRNFRLYNPRHAKFTSGYRLEGSYVFDENFRMSQTMHGTIGHTLRLVIDSSSIWSTKVYLDNECIGAFQEHFISRLKGGVFVLNNSGSAGLFRSFKIKECNEFHSNGAWMDCK